MLDKRTPSKVLQKIRIGNKLSRSHICERAMRLGPRCATFLDENRALISIDGKVYLYNLKENAIELEHSYDRGMKNPLSFCEAILPSGEKEIYYGEYIWNREKGPVAIYRRKEKWECVYKFPAHAIAHIHNIVYDVVREQFYILTGDEDNESGIWVADRGFTSVVPILRGKQCYRSCVAFATEEGLIYATDTPLETNYLYRVKLNGNQCVSVEQCCQIPGSCIFGTETQDAYYFATTVEPDSTLSKWKYRTTYKLGAGIQDRYSHIIQVCKTGEVQDIYQEKKDFWPIWLFQFGNIQFPGNHLEELYFTGQSLKHIDGKTIRFTNMED